MLSHLRSVKGQRKNPQFEFTLKTYCTSGTNGNEKEISNCFVEAQITELIFITNTCLTELSKFNMY